jgi:hypothetical protein
MAELGFQMPEVPLQTPKLPLQMPELPFQIAERYISSIQHTKDKIDPDYFTSVTMK